MSYILSIDSGTTATKIALFNEKGILIAESLQEYDLITPSSTVIEINAETLWKAFKNGTHEILKKTNINISEVKVIGISAQGETLILLDKKGIPLRNAIVWLDTRAQKESELIQNTFNQDEAYQITGQVKIVPTWPAAKMLWIKRNEPEKFTKISKILLVEDYLIYRLTGEFVSEGSLLCSTYYWNIIKKKWWSEMLHFIGITSDHLPEIREPGQLISNITLEAAKELGLTKRTLVATGALDNAAGAVGVGNIQPGIFSENTGATLAICSPISKPIFDTKRRMPIHYFAFPNTYMAHTFTTGGMALRWFRDKFCQTELQRGQSTHVDPYELMTKEAERIPPGSEGLVMLPHLQGAMAPESNPNAKGVFYGFTLRHTKGHFIRAIMEAIACIIQRNIEVLADMGIQVTEIRALGGGSRSKLWKQIEADLTKKPVITTSIKGIEACLGVALLAGTSIGIFKSVEDACKKIIHVDTRFEPNYTQFQVYNTLYKKYIQLYDNLIDLFKRNN